jgi:DNA-binding response OmpR family regulator
VYSEPGRGTTIKGYFPRVEGDADALDRHEEGPAPRGTETVLVVEDEAAVRELVQRILELQGYEVLLASNPEEAFELARQFDGPIHALLTDVVMPRGSGKDLARRLAQVRPAVRVLFMSGYTDQDIVHHGVLDSSVAFIQKPFTPRALAHRIRALLDEARPKDA